MTRSAGAGSASSQVLPITVTFPAGSMCSRIACDGSTAVTQSTRPASGLVCRPVPAPTSSTVADGRSHGSRKRSTGSSGEARIWLANCFARGAHQSPPRAGPNCASRARTRARQWAAQSMSSTASIGMLNIAPPDRAAASAHGDLTGRPRRASLALAPVLAAIDRSAAWLVQHGGGWQGSTLDVASTYGLHVLFLVTLLAAVVLLHRLHRTAVEAPEKDPRYSFHGGRVASPRAILFPYEAAYLAGGPPRVAETALAALVDEGWIESSPSGRLHLGVRGDLVTSPDPVGIPVLSVVAGAPPTASREIRRRAAHLRELRDVGRILYARRLIISGPVEERLRRLRWGTTAGLALAAVALIAVSAMRSGQLLSPPAIMSAGCLVLAVVTPALAWPRPLFRTALGDAELAALRHT